MGQVPRVWLGEIEFMKKNIAKLGGMKGGNKRQFVAVCCERGKGNIFLFTF